MLRFHLDEQVDHAIARGLAARGIDVTTTTDAGLLGAADEGHIFFAASEKRVIFTSDADFLHLAAGGVAHAGIAYCAPGSRSVGQIVQLLCLMHDCLSSAEVVGKIEFL